MSCKASGWIAIYDALWIMFIIAWSDVCVCIAFVSESSLKQSANRCRIDSCRCFNEFCAINIVNFFHSTCFMDTSLFLYFKLQRVNVCRNVKKECIETALASECLAKTIFSSIHWCISLNLYSLFVLLIYVCDDQRHWCVLVATCMLIQTQVHCKCA